MQLEAKAKTRDVCARGAIEVAEDSPQGHIPGSVQCILQSRMFRFKASASVKTCSQRCDITSTQPTRRQPPPSTAAAAAAAE